MNNLLLKAGKWLGELGVRTTVIDGHLGINIADLKSLGELNTIIDDINEGCNTTKLFWAPQHSTMEWMVIDSF